MTRRRPGRTGGVFEHRRLDVAVAGAAGGLGERVAHLYEQRAAGGTYSETPLGAWKVMGLQPLLGRPEDR